MKKKIGIEEKIVLITNTLGSWLVAGFFGNLGSIVGMVLGVYFVINFFCFVALIQKYYKD